MSEIKKLQYAFLLTYIQQQHENSTFNFCTVNIRNFRCHVSFQVPVGTDKLVPVEKLKNLYTKPDVGLLSIKLTNSDPECQSKSVYICKKIKTKYLKTRI